MEAMAFSFQQAIVRICAVRLKKPSKKKSLVLWRLDPGGTWISQGITGTITNSCAVKLNTGIHECMYIVEYV